MTSPTSPYGSTVLEHFRRPRNQRTLAAPTAAHEAFNPICGDRVRVEVLVAADVIAEAAFTASACAICTASASLLTERVTGMPVTRALVLTDRDVVEALETEVPAARGVCATLPLAAFHGALSQRPARRHANGANGANGADDSDRRNHDARAQRLT